MNAAPRAHALSPSFKEGFSPIAHAGFAPGPASRGNLNSARRRSRALALGATVLLQAALVAAAWHGLGTTPRPIPPAPFMVVDVVQETKILPPPQAPEMPRLAPPLLLATDVPEVVVAPSPDAITLATSVAQPQSPAQTRGTATGGQAAIATYQGLLLSHLARQKHYPAAARARRQQGVVHVRFSMDRRGVVTQVALAKSSGAGLLDNEGLDLLRRASPLPAPPIEVAGDPVEMVVPIEFLVR